jgi:tRNA-modifying protein YgfZ
VLLTDRSVLRVAGADARKLLQGLITNDIEKVRDGAAIHAGLLTPQGKILFDFFVVTAEDGFLLDVASAQSGELVKRLGFYRLRAQVEIREEPSLAVAGVWSGSPRLPDGAVAYADPRLPELGIRILLHTGTIAELHCAIATDAEYHAMRIGLGVPEGGRDFAYGDAFPHEALFDQLNGVDFRKGCFVGQEVVSRMEHRGTARKRVAPIEGEAALPEPGTSIDAEGAPLGVMGSVSGVQGLAMLRLDRVEQVLLRGAELKAGAVVIHLRELSRGAGSTPHSEAAP